MSSLIRSETGVKFSEGWNYNWGTIFLNEKVSYIFQTPFNTGLFTGSFVGMPGSFTVNALNQNLNLGSVGFNVQINRGTKNPWKFTLGYEGEFGSHYLSNQVLINFSKDFSF